MTRRWLHPWDAISWPAEAIALTSAGSLSASHPSTKKVPRTSRSARWSRIRGTSYGDRRGSASQDSAGIRSSIAVGWKNSSTSTVKWWKRWRGSSGPGPSPPRPRACRAARNGRSSARQRSMRSNELRNTSGSCPHGSRIARRSAADGIEIAQDDHGGRRAEPPPQCPALSRIHDDDHLVPLHEARRDHLGYVRRQVQPALPRHRLRLLRGASAGTDEPGGVDVDRRARSCERTPPRRGCGRRCPGRGTGRTSMGPMRRVGEGPALAARDAARGSGRGGPVWRGIWRPRSCQEASPDPLPERGWCRRFPRPEIPPFVRSPESEQRTPIVARTSQRVGALGCRGSCWHAGPGPVARRRGWPDPVSAGYGPHGSRGPTVVALRHLRRARHLGRDAQRPALPPPGVRPRHVAMGRCAGRRGGPSSSPPPSKRPSTSSSPGGTRTWATWCGTLRVRAWERRLWYTRARWLRRDSGVEHAPRRTSRSSRLRSSPSRSGG